MGEFVGEDGVGFGGGKAGGKRGREEDHGLEPADDLGRGDAVGEAVGDAAADAEFGLEVGDARAPCVGEGAGAAVAEPLYEGELAEPTELEHEDADEPERDEQGEMALEVGSEDGRSVGEGLAGRARFERQRGAAGRDVGRVH